MNRSCTMATALTAILMSGTALGAAANSEEFTEIFPLGECAFKSLGDNPYFLLKPGRQLHMNNYACVAAGDCTEAEENIITVLHDTRSVTLEIDGKPTKVITRVVEERESKDGALAEVSRNFFAECAGTQDVYYFGEEVDIYENGEIVRHDGAWLAGENGASPGIIMPGGAFLLGARYAQEVAPGVAMDRAEHSAMELEVTVPAGVFEACVEVSETTALNKQEGSVKVYCPGTGLVRDDDAELALVVE